MKRKILKNFGFGIIYFILGLYILFLILPIIANPFLSKYSSEISKMAEESCGLKIKIEKLGIVTTPKLTIGIKIENLSAAIPTGEEFLSVDNLKAKLSLIPIIYGKIEADVFSADNIDAILKVKPDGNLEITDYLPEEDTDENKEQFTVLPLGLKLSNRLPNVYINEYTLTMVDMRDKKEYSLQGGKLKVTDFIINKGIKVSTVGIAKLDGAEQFTYNLKIHNRIMPDIDLNDLIFANNNTTSEETQTATKSEQPVSFNIIDIFKGIKRNGLTADTNLNINISGKPDDIKINGLIDIEKLSMLINGSMLPEGHIKLQFNGNKAGTDIALYTTKNEETSINGTLIHGKKPSIDFTVKSNAGINNILNIVKTIAKSFNYNDLNTLSATGNIDANFNIKSDLKTLASDGYIRIPAATVKYALYNVLIDKINADVNLENNSVNIKNIGFSILSQPLKLYGTVTHAAIADLHLTADNLPVKGLITAAGQVALLKENDIKSGNLSMDVSVKGKLAEISPVANISAANLNILNKPTNTSIKLNNANVKFKVKDKNYNGDIDISALNIINPALKFSLPKIKISMDEKDINIADTYLMLDNSRIDISGKVTDYANKNMDMNILAKGKIFANDIKSMLPKDIKTMVTAKGAMPVLVKINGNDKKQTIKAQVLATPDGYFHIADLQAVTGKSFLLTSKINLNENKLNLENTAAYATSLKSLSDNTDSNVGGNKLLTVSGGISDISALKLDSVNISTVGPQSVSIPTFSGSKADLTANITLNGNAPDIKGNINVSALSLPTIKTNLKDVTVNFGKDVNVNLPLIIVDNSTMNIKAVLSPNFSNGIIVKSADFNSNMFDSDTLIATISKLPKQSGSNSSNSGLGIIIQTGKGSITKFKSGKIIATSLTSDFNMKNDIFTLKNLKGNAFNGTIEGIISCNILNGHTKVKLTGTKMKAVDAINDAAGIQNALSGTLGFDANLTLNAYAPSYNDILKSTKGSITFNIKDGHYMNIGTLDQFVLAGNIVSNTILKAALLPIKNMPVVKNSSEFTLIDGALDMSDGIATLKPVKSTGKTVAYYVTGKYNLLTGYTNVIILGRMGAEIVAVLGPLGQLSASKLTSYLPKFGTQTLNILNALTSDPANEKVSLIPKLTNTTTGYKDFKVLFIGNIMSPASVKTFKWLSICDTSTVEAGTIKEQVKAGVNAVKQTGKNNIQDVKKTVEATKTSAQNTANEIKNQVQKTKESIQELKNLKNMFKLPTQSTNTTTPATDATSGQSN